MHDFTAQLKQQASNPNKAFNSNTSRELASKARSRDYSQDVESLSLILDLIKTNEVNAQKEISKLKNQALKKKLLELNKQFNYFKYRVNKFQYFRDFISSLFNSVLKDGLVKPSLNDYKYEIGLLQPKLLEDVIRLTNNSKLLYITAIEGRKLKVEEYYQFVTENVIKFIDKINQIYIPLKTYPPINEQQLYEQLMKLSKGTFNRLNTKMVNYCKQKATLDLLSSINTQILQSQQKVNCQCTNNNLRYYRYQKRDHVKNIGLSRQKIQKKPSHKSLNQDQFREQSKNIQQRRNIINQLQKQACVLNDKNQRFAKQITSKQLHFKYFKSYETINQQNKRLLLQISKVKASNQHQQQQIIQLCQINGTMMDNSNSLSQQNQILKFSISSLNRKLKILQTKIQDYQLQEDKNLTNSIKQFEDIQQLNKKIDQQKLMIMRLQKKYIENVAQKKRLKQAVQKYQQELAQNEKSQGIQKIQRKIEIQSISKLLENQVEQNFLVISELTRENRQLSHSLQTLAAIQNTQRQQHFQYKNMLLKTIQFFTGNIREFNPVLIQSQIQSIQSSTNDVLNYIRSIKEVDELSQQSLEQFDNNKIDG